MARNSNLKGTPDNDMGRPSKFTPERRADIIFAISKRVPYQFAAESNGITERTLYLWLDIGAKHFDEEIESDYADFFQAIKKAEMQKIMEHMEMIAAKPERWQADAWLLERRWHKHFGSNAHLIELNNALERLKSIDSKHDNQEIE